MQDDSWPIFKLRMVCPGFRYYGGKVEYCHEQNRRVVRVRHGELHLEVSVCDHILDNAFGFSFREEISDFLETHYDKICLEKKLDQNEYAFGRGYSWRYVWNYSTLGECDSCKRSAQIEGVVIDLRRAIDWLEKPRMVLHETPSLHVIYERVSGDLIRNKWKPCFCSAECAAKYFGNECPWCGKCNENTLSDRFSSYRSKIRGKVELDSAKWAGWNYCSRHCCSLALNDYLLNEREERDRKKNLKCVQKVKRLLSKAKSSLRNHDSQEVLSLLKKEFEQAESSH